MKRSTLPILADIDSNVIEIDASSTEQQQQQNLSTKSDEKLAMPRSFLKFDIETLLDTI